MNTALFNVCIFLGERFEYARKLKQGMETLRSAGEKLGKYDLEKKHAIELEDYEKATHKKKQIEEFRGQIYLQLNIEQLLEVQGVSTNMIEKCIIMN